jgi:hypothetical protein
MEGRVQKLEDKVSKLESRLDVSDEKFNNIMLLLSDLKDSVKGIAENLQENQKRPIDLFYRIISGLFLMGLGVAIGWR